MPLVILREKRALIMQYASRNERTHTQEVLLRSPLTCCCCRCCCCRCRCRCCCCCCCCCCSHINWHNQVHGHTTGFCHSLELRNTPGKKHKQTKKVVHACIAADAIHASTGYKHIKKSPTSYSPCNASRNEHTKAIYMRMQCHRTPDYLLDLQAFVWDTLESTGIPGTQDLN